MLKLIVSLQTLMIYATELGKARMSGDPERIAAAQKKHDDYVEVCKISDEMHMGMTVGYMSGKR